MKNLTENLIRRYLAALRDHLASRRSSGLRIACALGRGVMAEGQGTLALARMHDWALAELAPSYDFVHASNGLIRRSGNFFAAALEPIEKAHQITRESLAQFRHRTKELRRHTAAMAKHNRELKREITRRKAGEVAVRRGKEHYRLLLVESHLMQWKLRHLARQMLSAQEDERREISRELHDEVVQTLVGINVHLAALGGAAAIGIRGLKAKIVLTQRLVEKSVNAVHQFARELRPAALDDLGLIPALRVYLKALAARKKGCKIRLTAFAGVEALDNAKRTVFYRVAQEAMTNVCRHACATEVTVVISQLSAAVRMEVHDNGKSFLVAQTLSIRTNQRLGLQGMRERVEMVGGTLLITSAPGKGTTVRADIPFLAGGVA